MTDPERDRATDPDQPIDESTYAGSSSETGGLYTASGPTIANPEGDTMAVEEGEEDEKDEGA